MVIVLAMKVTKVLFCRVQRDLYLCKLAVRRRIYYKGTTL